MRFLQALRALLQTWQGVVLSVLGVVLSVLAVAGAIYYGPRKMLETWDWYRDRFCDNEVFFLIERRKILSPPRSKAALAMHLESTELAYTAQEIAEYLRRKESSVNSSLKRLTRRGKIEPYQDGWRLKSR